MKCANCNNDAMYEYKITQGSSIFYCGKDLPRFLEPRKAAGLLTLTTKHEEAKQDAIAAVTTPAEEAPVEEASAPKRTAKKTAK